MTILTLPTASEIIAKTQKQITLLKIKPGREKYKELVLQEAENYKLNENQVKELARHLGITVLSPPKNAKGWTLSICKIYMSLKYTNPNEPKEFIVMVSSRSLFGVQGIIHHTPNGYLDISWFKNFVMDLDLYSQAYENGLKSISPNLTNDERIAAERKLFTYNVNTPINRAFSNGLTVEQLRAAHAFFLKYIPQVEGICKNCFCLSLPQSGAGARWISQPLNSCEIRLSAPKPDGYPCQQVLYLTQNYKVNRQILHLSWSGIYTDSPALDKILKQANTHIPWNIYDYESLVNRLPTINSIQTTLQTCLCKKIP